MTDPEKTLILSDDAIRSKIIRMAFEIVENNLNEKSLVLAGVTGQGYTLARLLEKELRRISELKILLVKISIDKQSPESSLVKLDATLSDLKNKSIVLVDDVLNTGKILTYSMKPFLAVSVKKIEVAVLVNRSHLLFPVHPNYTGHSLSTTLKDHIEVILSKKYSVYLH
jgi:pyrimidine operon attenuation protein/uracil phosphoribosyltransferase